MARAGDVKISITPADARMVADWLTAYRAPQSREFQLKGSRGSILAAAAAAASSDDHNLAAVTLVFQKAAKRKWYFSYPAAKRPINISRSDARWLALKVKRGGLPSHVPTSNLPPVVAEVARKCAEATGKKRGRPSLMGNQLDEAITAQIDAEHGGDRHLRRLRIRRRREQTARERGAILRRLLNLLK